jgi:hypothetical protein
MGFGFFSLSLGTLFGGLVARFSRRLETGEAAFVLEDLPGFFLMLVVFPMSPGLLFLVLTPLLRRMMHGVR